MKVTHVISDTNVGGAGVLLCYLISATKDFCQSSVVLPRGSALKNSLSEHTDNVTELPVRGNKSFSAQDVAKFYTYFKAHPTDIVHTHASLSSRIGASLAGSRICISTRHCAHPESETKKKSPMQIKVYNFCTNLTVSTADCATKNLIAEGIDRDRIVTIKNGVPRRKKLGTGVGVSTKRELSLPENARIVGSCARLETVKGQDLILRAAPKIIKLIPHVYFVFVGDGGARGYYERLAARLGILERVRFVGFRKDPEVFENIFDVNVNSSRGTETSCLSTSECMSLGIPTVASDFGGNREMIRDGVNGLLFKTDNHFSLEDKLLTVLADRELYVRLSLGATEIFNSYYSVERMAAEYMELYTSLFSRACAH